LPPEAGPLRFVVTVGLFYAFFRAGRLADAQQALLPLKAALEPQAVVNNVGVAAMESMNLRLQGQLRAARRLSQQAVDLANVTGRPLLDAGAILAYAVLGRVEFEQLEWDEAEIHWRECAELAAVAGTLSTHIYALTNLAELALARHDLPQARQWLEQAQVLVQGKPLTPSMQLTLEAGLALLQIAQGQAAQAQAWAALQHGQGGVGTPRLSPFDMFRLIEAQAQLAQGQAPTALETLAMLLSDAEATAQGDFTVKALALQAVACQQTNRTSQALVALRRALALAEPQNYLTIFVEQGTTLQPLLATVADQSSLEPALRTFARAVLACLGPTAPTPNAALVEPLTDRELEVLHLVAQGLTDRQIAEKLVVVIGTVKKHLSNIYGKLGVGSRTQALAAARDLGLLSA
jgi:LuxR family maltose regulon positive regulatory protein